MGFGSHDPALPLAVIDEGIDPLQQDQCSGDHASIPPDEAQGCDGRPVGWLAQLCLWWHPASNSPYN